MSEYQDNDRTRIVRSLLAGQEIAWQTLDAVSARLSTDLFGAQGWSASPDLAGDPRVLDVVDLFQAIEMLDPEEPAFSWNQAGLLCDLGRYAEGAEDFLEAARKLEAGINEGWIPPDEAEWIESARAYAAEAFLLAGRLVAATVVWRKLSDSDYREDIQAKIEAVASDPTTAQESLEWIPHPRWQDLRA